MRACVCVRVRAFVPTHGKFRFGFLKLRCVAATISGCQWIHIPARTPPCIFSPAHFHPPFHKLHSRNQASASSNMAVSVWDPPTSSSDINPSRKCAWRHRCQMVGCRDAGLVEGAFQVGGVSSLPCRLSGSRWPSAQMKQ